MAQEQTNKHLSTPSAESVRQAFRDLWKFLSFRATNEDYDRFHYTHLFIGLGFTWLVGIARNWDYPQAPLWATFGLGSVAYIFVLSAILFIFAWPASEDRQSYLKFLTVVSMTAPPGLIYGIPVEKFMSLGAAQQANLIFLLIVALWRVSLALHFFVVAIQDSFMVALSMLLAPISLIIIGLVMTGRAGYVVQLMGGVRDAVPTVQSNTDEFIAGLFCLVWPVLVLALAIYLIQLITCLSSRRD